MRTKNMQKKEFLSEISWSKEHGMKQDVKGNYLENGNKIPPCDWVSCLCFHGVCKQIKPNFPQFLDLRIWLNEVLQNHVKSDLALPEASGAWRWMALGSIHLQRFFWGLRRLHATSNGLRKASRGSRKAFLLFFKTRRSLLMLLGGCWNTFICI